MVECLLRKSIGVKWGFVCVWSLYTQKHPRTGVLMGAWRFDATVDEKLHESLWLDPESGYACQVPHYGLWTKDVTNQELIDGRQQYDLVSAFSRARYCTRSDCNPTGRSLPRPHSYLIRRTRARTS